MEIIKHGDQILIVDCKVCHCRFKCLEKDVEEYRDYYRFTKSVKCPECDSKITIQEVTLNDKDTNAIYEKGYADGSLSVKKELIEHDEAYAEGVKRGYSVMHDALYKSLVKRCQSKNCSPLSIVEITGIFGEVKEDLIDKTE